VLITAPTAGAKAFRQLGVPLRISGHYRSRSVREHAASMAKLTAASQRRVADDPFEFLSGMNTALLGNTQDHVVTAAYVHLNSESKELRYSAAGHSPLLLVRNGDVTQNEENGLLLSAFDYMPTIRDNVRQDF